jgi:hypothetical protein
MNCYISLTQGVFGFLLDRLAPAQRSARRFVSVSSHAACRGGLTVHDGSHTNDHNDMIL